MVAYGREPCTHAMIQRTGADAMLRRLICSYCPLASFDRVVCKHGQPPKVRLGSSWPRAWSRATAGTPADPPRSHDRQRREDSPDPEPPTVRGRGNVFANSRPHGNRFLEDRAGAKDDLRHAQRHVSTSNPRRSPDGKVRDAAALQDHAHETHGHRSQERDGGREREERRREDRRRRDAQRPDRERSPSRGPSPVQRQGFPGPGTQAAAYDRRHRAGLQRGTSGRHEPDRGESVEPSRADRRRQPSRAKYKSRREARQDDMSDDRGLGQATPEYLPPAPARPAPEAMPLTQAGQAGMNQTGMPIVDHSFCGAGLQDTTIAGLSAGLPPTGTIHANQFQAAVAVAVQEVVKSMGLIPAGAAGGVPSVVSAPMILGPAHPSVQPDSYNAARGHGEQREDLTQQRVQIDSLQHEYAPESWPMQSQDGHARPQGGGEGRRYGKRSRIVDEETSQQIHPARVVPRHASPHGGHALANPPQQQQRRLHVQSHYHEGHEPHRMRKGTQNWRSVSPSNRMLDTEAWSSPRGRPPAHTRERVAHDVPGHTEGAVVRSRSPRHEREADALSPRHDRYWREDVRRPTRAERNNSPQRDMPRSGTMQQRHDTSSDLPLPPRHETHMPWAIAPGDDFRSSRGHVSEAPPDLRSQATGIKKGRQSIHARSQSSSRHRNDDSKARQDHGADHTRRSSLVVSESPIIKLRSGGSRVAQRRRSNAKPGLADNEDAFAVEYNCFAVGDGFEGKENAKRGPFNSGKFTHELVANATGFATSQIQVYVGEQGRNLLMDPVRVLQQASNSVRSTGAAAVLLGMLNPLSGRLSIGKVGDVGYLVLRPPGLDERGSDLKVRPSVKPCAYSCITRLAVAMTFKEIFNAIIPLSGCRCQ